jgi:hypothetical protein
MKLWGKSFGRPGEEGHKLLSVTLTDSCLRLNFSDDETLAIWDPTGIRLEQGELVVLGASAMRWTSYKDLLRLTPESLTYRDYARQEDGTIAFRTNADEIPGTGVMDREWAAAHAAVILEARRCYG